LSFSKGVWRPRLAALAVTVMGAWAVLAQNPGDALERGFQNPPDSARPRVWWHWMNGNITWEGVQADMDWMKRVGIRGLQSFDAGESATQVVETRLPYMTDGWRAVFRNAAASTGRLPKANGWGPGADTVSGPKKCRKEEHEFIV
jgi:hypothetical protein